MVLPDWPMYGPDILGTITVNTYGPPKESPMPEKIQIQVSQAPIRRATISIAINGDVYANYSFALPDDVDLTWDQQVRELISDITSKAGKLIIMLRHYAGPDGVTTIPLS